MSAEKIQSYFTYVPAPLTIYEDEGVTSLFDIKGGDSGKAGLNDKDVERLRETLGGSQIEEVFIDLIRMRLRLPPRVLRYITQFPQTELRLPHRPDSARGWTHLAGGIAEEDSLMYLPSCNLSYFFAHNRRGGSLNSIFAEAGQDPKGSKPPTSKGVEMATGWGLLLPPQRDIVSGLVGALLMGLGVPEEGSSSHIPFMIKVMLSGSEDDEVQSDFGGRSGYLHESVLPVLAGEQLSELGRWEDWMDVHDSLSPRNITHHALASLIHLDLSLLPTRSFNLPIASGGTVPPPLMGYLRGEGAGSPLSAIQHPSFPLGVTTFRPYHDTPPGGIFFEAMVGGSTGHSGSFVVTVHWRSNASGSGGKFATVRNVAAEEAQQKLYSTVASAIGPGVWGYGVEVSPSGPSADIIGRMEPAAALRPGSYHNRQQIAAGVPPPFPEMGIFHGWPDLIRAIRAELSPIAANWSEKMMEQYIILQVPALAPSPLAWTPTVRKMPGEVRTGMAWRRSRAHLEYGSMIWDCLLP